MNANNERDKMKHRKLRLENFPDVQFRLVYEYVLTVIDGLDTESAIDFCSFIIDCLKINISSTMRMGFLLENIQKFEMPRYGNGKQLHSYIRSDIFLPQECKKNGVTHSAVTDEYAEINLAETTIFANTAKTDSIISVLRSIKKNGFIFDRSSQRAQYISYLDICTFIGDGIHSLTVGNFYKQGKILAKVVRIEEMFDYVKTDGVRWYCDDDYGTVLESEDYRVSLLFEIAKLRFNLERKSFSDNKLESDCDTMSHQPNKLSV